MTGESQWERPAAMGATPHESGWFGRGAAGSAAAEGYEERNKAYLKKPARKQIEHVPSKDGYLEGAYEYNIWCVRRDARRTRGGSIDRAVPGVEAAPRRA
jgi:hypothetical protein